MEDPSESTSIKSKSQQLREQSINGLGNRINKLDISQFKSRRGKQRTRVTKEEYIQRCNHVWNSAYDYTDSDVTIMSEKIDIWCNKHELYFNQLASNHMYGHISCEGCKRDNFETTFIAQAKKVHGDKYDYSQVRMLGPGAWVTLRCKKHDHVFKCSPIHHKRGNICPKCKSELESEK